MFVNIIDIVLKCNKVCNPCICLITEMSADNPARLRVPTNPSNPFNDPWNVGILLGSVTGFVCAYFVGSKIVPFMRKVSSAVMLGETKMALVVNTELRMSKGTCHTFSAAVGISEHVWCFHLFLVSNKY